jgi:four helix bundle protein
MGQGSRGKGQDGSRKSFRKLLAWQKAYELALEVYKTTGEFPKNEVYGLSSQIRRASASVPANVAEGYERQHRKEYVQHSFIARGSLGEVET